MNYTRFFSGKSDLLTNFWGQ